MPEQYARMIWAAPKMLDFIRRQANGVLPHQVPAADLLNKHQIPFTE